jgi:hypothetical protein
MASIGEAGQGTRSMQRLKYFATQPLRRAKYSVGAHHRPACGKSAAAERHELRVPELHVDAL